MSFLIFIYCSHVHHFTCNSSPCSIWSLHKLVCCTLACLVTFPIQLILTYSGDQLEVGYIYIGTTWVNIFVYVFVTFAPEFKATKMLPFSSIVGLLCLHFHLQQIHDMVNTVNYCYKQLFSWYEYHENSCLDWMDYFLECNVWTHYILKGNPFSSDLCMCMFHEIEAC